MSQFNMSSTSITYLNARVFPKGNMLQKKPVAMPSELRVR